MTVYNLNVVGKKDKDDLFLPICPALHGCNADGETVEDALQSVKG